MLIIWPALFTAYLLESFSNPFWCLTLVNKWLEEILLVRYQHHIVDYVSWSKMLQIGLAPGHKPHRCRHHPPSANSHAKQARSINTHQYTSVTLAHTNTHQRTSVHISAHQQALDVSRSTEQQYAAICNCCSRRARQSSIAIFLDSIPMAWWSANELLDSFAVSHCPWINFKIHHDVLAVSHNSKHFSLADA